MMIPGVQKPHWLAPVARERVASIVLGRGVEALERRDLGPPTRATGVTHATRGAPSTRTVQHPHWPWGLHPSFAEVMCSWSRNRSSSEPDVVAAR